MREAINTGTTKLSLYHIQKYAKFLNVLIEDESNVESWVQYKISDIESSIYDVFHYYENKGKYSNGGKIGKYRFKIDGEIYDLERDGDYVVMKKDKKAASIFGIQKFNSLVEEGNLKKIASDGLDIEPYKLEENLDEAKDVVGEEMWKMMSYDERLKFSEELKSKQEFDKGGIVNKLENILLDKGFKRIRGHVGTNTYRFENWLADVTPRKNQIYIYKFTDSNSPEYRGYDENTLKEFIDNNIK